MTVVNGDELAAALADRFQRIVPEGFQVRDDDGMLWYSVDPALSFWGGGGSGSYVRLNFDSHHGPLNERVVAVSEHSLNELQDFVDEESALPWPGDRTVPLPHAEIIGTKLHLWFGDADAPVLECEPIDLRLLG